MAGFGLFGKNTLNILPFFLGVWLYARHRHRPMKTCLNAALYSTTLAPFVSAIALQLPMYRPLAVLIALLVGTFIGYIIVPLAEHAFSSHKGYILFNFGFAGGLLALVLTSVLRALGSTIETANIWKAGVPRPIFIYLCVVIGLLLLAGLYLCRWSLRPVLALFRHAGRSPSDFVKSDGIGPSLVNMALVGALSLGYILAIGGDLSGPVAGAVLTSIGFGAAGEHPRNSLPVIAGVYLASAVITHDATLPGLQLAALFGTALAPISGEFGWFAGIIAGFLHACVVLAVGPLCGGYNLYNNGFAAGIVALILASVMEDVLGLKPAD